MDGHSLQFVLAGVVEDDLAKATKRVEDERKAWKALRKQDGTVGLTAGELVEQLTLSADDGEGSPVPSLHKQETPDAPKKVTVGGFFAPPPGSGAK